MYKEVNRDFSFRFFNSHNILILSLIFLIVVILLVHILHKMISPVLKNIFLFKFHVNGLNTRFHIKFTIVYPM